jgi:hypothetical protein
MSDPVGERLRSYYESIQGDAPAGLEARVARAFESTPAARPVNAPWRPFFGLAAAGAGLLVIALVVRGLGPGPVPSQSAMTGPSASMSVLPDASQSESPTLEPTPTPIPNPTGIGESPSPTPLHSRTPTSTPTETPIPVVTPLRSTGNVVSLGAMAPYLTGPAVNLNDATVLVVGGLATQSNGVKVKSNLAELYQMGSHTFVATGSMGDARYGHTATLLRDGRVLVVGGADMMDGIDNLATAELYNPLTGKFTRTGSMAQGRANHTATLLADGRVLIAGGYGGGTLPLASAEIYDPTTGKFTTTGPMTVARMNHTATLLAGGSVLITGGVDSNSNVLSSAEIYNSSSATFHATGSMTTPREVHTATTLGDDRVLIVGGFTGGSPSLGPVVLASAEIYNPGTGKFTATGSMKTARQGHTATLLIYGQVIVAGGTGTDSMEVYWPDTGQFGYQRTLPGPVSAAATMSDRVLLTGSSPQLYCAWPASQGACQ